MFPVSLTTLQVFVFDGGEHFARPLFGGFARRHSYGAALAEIAESGGDFAEIPELQRALAQPAPGDDRNRVGGAAIDLDKRHEALPVGAGRVFDAQEIHPMEGHTKTQNLAGAKMAVGLFRQAFVFRER